MRIRFPFNIVSETNTYSKERGGRIMTSPHMVSIVNSEKKGSPCDWQHVQLQLQSIDGAECLCRQCFLSAHALLGPVFDPSSTFFPSAHQGGDFLSFSLFSVFGEPRERRPTTCLAVADVLAFSPAAARYTLGVKLFRLLLFPPGLNTSSVYRASTTVNWIKREPKSFR